MNEQNYRSYLFLISVFLLYICCSCVQQKRISLGVNKASRTTFIAKKADSKRPNSSIYVLDADSNRYKIKQGQKVLNDVRVKLNGGKTVVHEIIREVLGPKIAEFQKTMVVFIVRIYPDFDGNVLGVDFLIGKDVNMSAKELEQISRKIKEREGFYVPEDIDRRYRLTPIGLRVNFNK